MTRRKGPFPIRPQRLREAYIKTTVHLEERHVRYLGNGNRAAKIRSLIDAEIDNEKRRLQAMLALTMTPENNSFIRSGYFANIGGKSNGEQTP